MTAPDDALAAIEARAAAAARIDRYALPAEVLASLADVPALLATIRSLRAHVASEPERTAAAVEAETAAERARTAALRDAATDLAETLSRREDACRASAKEAPAGEVRSRLMGKTSAYGHAAELLTRVLLDTDAIAATGGAR